MCNNSTNWNRRVKKFQFHSIDQSFENNGIGIIYQKKLESLEEKKAVHPSCKQVSEGFANQGGPAGKLTWCEPLETIWIIVDETTYKDPAP